MSRRALRIGVAAPGLLLALACRDEAPPPAGTTMFAYSPDDAIVQVHGTGSFHIAWKNGVKTLDDADAATVFALRRGERVQAPRGRGVIRQGYASGVTSCSTRSKPTAAAASWPTPPTSARSEEDACAHRG
jgi:hypothetical protein